MVLNIKKLSAAVDAISSGAFNDCLTDSDIKEILLNNSTEDFGEAYYEVDLAKHIRDFRIASEVFRKGDLYAQVGILESLKADEWEAIEFFNTHIEYVKDIFVLEELLGLVSSPKGVRRIASMFNLGKFKVFDTDEPQNFLSNNGYRRNRKGDFVPDDDVIFPNTDPRGLSGGAPHKKKLQFGDE